MEGRVLLAQGHEAEVFLLPDGSVLKLLRSPDYADRAEREAVALRALRNVGPLVPELIDTITVEGRPGLVMERLDGTDLLAALQRRPLRFLTAGRVLGEVHAAMHELQAPTELPELKGELAARMERAEHLPDEFKQKSLDVLSRLPSGDRLCHGDLHVGNMLGSWSAPVLIDWGNAARGHPLADVARTELLHRSGELPPGTPRLFRAVARVGRNALTARYLAIYRRRRPVDDAELDRWRIVNAAARLGEEIPEEVPGLLDYLRRQLTAV